MRKCFFPFSGFIYFLFWKFKAGERGKIEQVLFLSFRIRD